jgi:hypothetical protein
LDRHTKQYKYNVQKASGHVPRSASGEHSVPERVFEVLWIISTARRKGEPGLIGRENQKITVIPKTTDIPVGEEPAPMKLLLSTTYPHKDVRLINNGSPFYAVRRGILGF